MIISRTAGFIDTDIRPRLRRRALAHYRDDPDTVLIEELGLKRGLVRLDLACVTGFIHGYEIKSDRDNLKRLDRQVEIYSQILDRATLVASPRHIESAISRLPLWWEVWVVEPARNGPRFISIRRGRKNPDRNPRALVELLWQDEALKLLEQHNAAKGVRGKARHYLWDRICETLDLDTIAGAVRTRLKARSKPINTH